MWGVRGNAAKAADGPPRALRAAAVIRVVLPWSQPRSNPVARGCLCARPLGARATHLRSVNKVRWHSPQIHNKIRISELLGPTLFGAPE